MNPEHVSTLTQIGGYVLSLLLGAFVFLLKREVSRYDEAVKVIKKSGDDAKAELIAKVDELNRKIEGYSNAAKEKWDAHRDKHDETAASVQAKLDELIERIQRTNTDLLHHCAEASEKYLTKDDFVASTTYLTKKTDEVSRLLQSIENTLSRK